MHLEENVHTTHKATIQSMSACIRTLTQGFHGAVTGERCACSQLDFVQSPMIHFPLSAVLLHMLQRNCLYLSCRQSKSNHGINGKRARMIHHLKILDIKADIHACFCSDPSNMVNRYLWQRYNRIFHSMKVQYLRIGNSNHHRYLLLAHSLLCS